MGLRPRITYRRQWKRCAIMDGAHMTERSLAVPRWFRNLFVGCILRQSLVDIDVRVVAIVVAVDPDCGGAAEVPVIVECPCWADDYIAAFHRIRFMLADKDCFLRRFPDQARLTAEIAMCPRAFAGHENLRIHPDRKTPSFDADNRTHAGHSVGPNSYDLPRAHKTSINPVPFPVRCGVAFARRLFHFPAQTGADEMMPGEKTFQIFVGRADFIHGCSPFLR